MGRLRPISYDWRAAAREVKAYRVFLAANPRGERSDILPFFGAHRHLCAILATFNAFVGEPDHIAFEFPLWGEFICDLVTGSRDDGAFVFVEFESASPTSLFRASARRRVSRWGSRAEGGISQIADWLFRLDSARDTMEIERDFGRRRVRPDGLLVVGRRADISAYDAQRVRWRCENTLVGGSRVGIMTYDDLLDWLGGRVETFRDARQRQ